MRYLFSLGLSILLVSALTVSCEMTPGDNEDGTTGDDNEVETTDTAARTTGFSAITAASMGNYAGEEYEDDRSLQLSSETVSRQIPSVEGPDGDGYFTIEVDPDTFYVRWLDSSEDPIIGEGSEPSIRLSNTVNTADEAAKYFYLEGDFRELEVPAIAPELEHVNIMRNEPDFVFEFNTIGDIRLEDGAYADGNWYLEYEEGGYADFDFIDFEVEGIPTDDGDGIKWIAVGGRAEGETVIEDDSGTSYTYESVVTFNEDGTGEGTITSQDDDDYEADYYIDTRTGSGHYEDGTGEHDF